MLACGIIHGCLPRVDSRMRQKKNPGAVVFQRQRNKRLRLGQRTGMEWEATSPDSACHVHVGMQVFFHNKNPNNLSFLRLVRTYTPTT
jgi:hypothetical protein